MEHVSTFSLASILTNKSQAKATRFLAFLNGYTIFLGPLLGIMLCDWLVVHRKDRIDLIQLYQPQGIYRYFKGFNLRAIGAFIMGTSVLYPGLLYNIGVQVKNKPIVEIFSMAWLFGATVSAIFYYIFNRIWPLDGTFSERIYADQEFGEKFLDGVEAPPSLDGIMEEVSTVQPPAKAFS